MQNFYAMSVSIPFFSNYWHLITRLGEVQYLLPAALGVCLVLIRSDATRLLAVRWLQTLLIAALITLASKIAFIGWGIGSARFNFTGVSGHAMFAASIVPLLVATLASRFPQGWQKLAVFLSFALVLLVGVSRVAVGAHSASEVIAGLLLGSVASAMAIAHKGLPRGSWNQYVPMVVLAWLVLAPFQAPQLPTHSLVTWSALQLSGHAKPYTRTDMMRERHARTARQPASDLKLKGKPFSTG